MCSLPIQGKCRRKLSSCPQKLNGGKWADIRKIVRKRFDNDNLKLYFFEW